MDWHAVVKLVHLGCAGLSLGLFVLRGYWMMVASPRLQARWVRILPHANDTLLLAAGVALVVLTRQYPGRSPWLSAKLGAIAVYILLGMLALRPGPPRAVRLAAWCAAILVFAYIVAVAVTRSATPGLD